MIGVAVAGAAYLYLKPAAVGSVSQRPVPQRTKQRVMGYAGLMLRYGVEQGVNPALIASVITVESSGNRDAKGAAGEVGLMQILPSTAMWIGKVDPEQLKDPAVNIQTGTGYLRYCVDQQAGSVAAGIASYNYGPGRVSIENGQVIAPQVVLNYARSVLGYVSEYRRLLKEYLGNFYQVAFPTEALILN